MTVQNTTRFIRANGDGAVVAFQFSFPAKLTTDVTVKKIVNSTGVATTQTVGVDYTITLDTVQEGGTVTYTVAPTALEDSFIVRETTQDQQTGLPIGGNFPEISVENEIDRSRMIDIELQEQIGRCIIISDTESLTGINAPMGSNVANRATKIWGWDSVGTAMTLYTATVVDAVSVISSKGDLVRGSDVGAAEQLSVGADGSFLTVWDGDGKPNWSQLGKAGADVASTTALPLLKDGTKNDVTGTTTITSFNSVGIGAIKWLRFTGALILTHHVTNLILPNSVNITTIAGDIGCFREYGSGTWRLIGWAGHTLEHTHASAAQGGSLGQLELTDVTLTGSAASTPDANTLTKDHLIGARCTFNGTGTPAYIEEINFTGAITDSGVGEYVLTIDRDFANANYAINVTCLDSATASFICGYDQQAVGSIGIHVVDTADGEQDLASISVVLIGAQ